MKSLQAAIEPDQHYPRLAMASQYLHMLLVIMSITAPLILSSV